MALNLTTIRNTKPTTLTILKKTSINTNPRLHTLSSRSNSPYTTYPINPDPAYHLNPGDQVTLTGILSAQEAGYRHPHIKCMTSSGIEFYVTSTDIGRFLGL
jgi:hypothetical protein